MSISNKVLLFLAPVLLLTNLATEQLFASGRGNCPCPIYTNVFPGSAENNNVPITYLTAGSKSNPAVLLIHGNGGVADGWIGVMEEMCKNYYLIAPYRRGTAPSGQPDTGFPLIDYSLVVTTSDFMLVLQQEGVRNPAIIAHSYSGRFAEQYYFQYLGDPIYAASSITLLATSFTGSIKGQGLVAITAAINSGNLDAVATAFADYSVTVSCNQGCPCLTPKKYAALQTEVYNGALQTSIYAYQSYNTVAGPTQTSSNFITPGTTLPSIPFGPSGASTAPGTLADITIPVYIIGGDQDEVNVPINLAILTASLPVMPVTNLSYGFVEELRGVPHFSFLTNYELLAQKFTAFLKQIDERCSFLILK